MLSTFNNTLMSAEADAICGAPYGTSAPERVNARNGPAGVAVSQAVGSAAVGVAVPLIS